MCYTEYVAKNKKQCRYCFKWYLRNSFGVALTTPTKVYRRLKCRHCYRLTKQALIQRNYKWLSEVKRRHGCIKCGITNPLVLDFHHKDEKNKSFALGTFRRSVGTERIKGEIKKCEIICANCHRIEHYNRLQIKLRNGA